MTFPTRALAVLLLLCNGGVDLRSSHLSGAARSLAVRPRLTSSARTLATDEIWSAQAASKSLREIGRGKGILFSPDLSEPGNRAFYSALGFAYFEGPDWRAVLGELKAYNQAHPKSPVEVLLVQSHGTNGDALKLQNNKQPDAPRSYISPAGLLENLQGTGVHTCLLAACNAGRLFRPEHYYAVRAGEGNLLFEPATLGAINASSDFDSDQSSVTFGRRAESHIELINECRISEFSPVVQTELLNSHADLAAASRIAVPEMLIQLMLRDDQLHLVSDGFELEKSRVETDDNYREQLIHRFLQFVDSAANR